MELDVKIYMINSLQKRIHSSVLSRRSNKYGKTKQQESLKRTTKNGSVTTTSTDEIFKSHRIYSILWRLS